MSRRPVRRSVVERGDPRSAPLRPEWIAARIAAWIVAWLSVAVGPAAVGAEPAGRLVSRDGGRDGASPERIDGERSAWRLPAGGSLELPTADVVSWRDCPPWPVGPVVLLADGGVLAGTIAAVEDHRVAVVSPLLGRLDLPRGGVAGFRRSRGIGPGPLAPGSAGRRLVLSNDDVVDAAAVDWRPGAVRAGTAAGDVTIPPDVVDAIDLAAGERRAGGGLRLLAALADGSRLSVAALRPAAAAGRLLVVIETADGPREVAVDRGDVVALAVDGGAARLLAGLEPAGYSHEPLVGPEWPLAVGRSLTGDWPSARGLTGFTALGIHATATVRYRLGCSATRFSATVAIDDTTDGGGAAVVRVRARTGAGPWRDVVGPEILRGSDAPRSCGADLGGADEIEIAVTGDAAGDVLARTIWIDPRIVAER
jgi:hypothetical protein